MKKIVVLLFLLCVASVFASNVAVWTLDEQRNSNNLTVLRFKIKNTSERSISELELHYNITHSVSNLANPEIYYLPNGTAEWSIKDSINATLIIRFPNIVLAPNEELTDASGFAIGIHALNWSVWNKDDDYSEPFGYEFNLAENIDVYSNGVLLSGGALVLPETGTVKLYLIGEFKWDGYFATQTIESVAGRFFIHTKYNKTMFLNSSFGGQVKAPNAWVVVGQADKEYAGQIHARRITIHQGSRFLWIKEGQNALSPIYSYSP